MSTPCWLKHLCSIRTWVPTSFFLSIFLSFCLSLSLYFWLIPWSSEARWAHFLARASKPLSRRRPVPTCSSASPENRALLAFRVNQGVSASFSLLLSEPPGSGPLKDQHPWTVAHQAPLSMGFSRQEYWSGLPFPSPGDLPNPGIEPRSPALQAGALTSEPNFFFCKGQVVNMLTFESCIISVAALQLCCYPVKVAHITLIQISLAVPPNIHLQK